MFEQVRLCDSRGHTCCVGFEWVRCRSYSAVGIMRDECEGTLLEASEKSRPCAR